MENVKMNSANAQDENSASPAKTRNITVTDDRMDSRNIFAGTREVMISHSGEVYRLRLTAQNKLILTK